MDEREYRRRVEARRRIISQEEMEQREKLKRRKNPREERPKKRADVQAKYRGFIGSVLGLAILIIAFAFYLLFYTQQIEVTGSEYSDSGTIVEWLASDPLCRSSVAMCIKYNYTDAELPPQVESIRIRMVNPWTISVESIDKEPVGGIATETSYIYCDIDGIVLLETDTPLEDMPLIDGVTATEYTLYEIVNIDDIDIFRNALEVTSILNLVEIDFDSISCSSGAGVNVIIGGITVKLGEENYQEKIMQLSPVLEEISGKEGTLDLENYSSSNTSITFTQKNAEN